MHMPDLLILGILFLIGWITHVVSTKAHIPRITLLLSVGVITGPSGFNVVPPEIAQHLSTVAHLALAMVGFLLGESFVGRDFQKEKRHILLISLGASLIPAIVVFVATLLVSGDVVLALVLGGIATATDPAATLDVIREVNAQGPLTRMLKGVVAIDDAWGVIVFSLVLVAALMLTGNGNGVSDVMRGFRDVGGALLLGVAVGLPMAFVIGRNKPGEPTMVEAMGFVFICGGLALLWDFSYLLACMALGATVARRARYVDRPFHEVEKASEPFLIVFFLLSGLSLDLLSLKAIGWIGIVFILSRAMGKMLGAGLTAKYTSADQEVQYRLGACLLPQAGVAIGMALLVADRLPEIGNTVLSLTVASTVFFELLGPVVTRWNLYKAGETGQTTVGS